MLIMQSLSALPILALARCPGTERAETRSDRPAIVARRPVHDDQRREAVGGGLQLPEVERRIRRRARRGDDQGHVVRPAAGHDRRHRDLLDRGDTHGRPHFAEDHVGVQPGREDQPVNALGRRDHHRQPVGTVQRVEMLEGRLLADRLQQFAHAASRSRTSSTMLSAIALIRTSPVPATGWGNRTMGMFGIPTDSATNSACGQKSSVTRQTAGMPSLAMLMPSRTVPEVQLPQWP